MWYTGGRIHRPYTSSLNNVSFVEGAIGYASSGSLLIRIAQDSSYYPSIQAACDAADSGQTIEMQAQNFTENLTLTHDVIVSLKGGYDTGFLLNPGMTILTGCLTISGGTVIVENLIIR